MAATARSQGTLRAQDRAPAAPETLLTDRQRRLVFALVAAGVTYLLVGLLMPPRGGAFWAAFMLAPPILGGVAALFGGRQGLDAWLLTGGVRHRAAPPAPLGEPARQALRIALVPALLAELSRASAGLQPAEKAAAGRLLEAAIGAWNAAADDTARAAIAQALPRLVAGLVAGGPDAIRAADAFVGGAR
ncbi:hypothetical protein [Roseomonas sp. CECT 9278]|uniref:hypothetical protein n=1 Tax=Roseomonas sp. CECT 9278 TaxID=2845823 RepID=UPI001E456746|nr:hypothetical protein [Roseomonas sp. CECT 9278]CAH0309895.1 hypothetical protein ROS9278_04887 [Roseomonas sp. CECT 9278]